jgi:hypothetical protein
MTLIVKADERANSHQLKKRACFLIAQPSVH